VAHRGRENADEALIAALASGQTVQDAAKTAGVSARTAHRRLDDPAFARRVTEARSEMVKRAVGQLAEASAEAVTTLRALLRAESETARLGAARSILELGSRLRESTELEERLSALEAAAT